MMCVIWLWGGLSIVLVASLCSAVYYCIPRTRSPADTLDQRVVRVRAVRVRVRPDGFASGLARTVLIQSS